MRRHSDSPHPRGRRVLTRAGTQVLVVGGVLIATGRLLGLAEILGLGVTSWILLACAIVWVHVRPLRLRVERELSPSTVFAGETMTVTVTAANVGRGTSSPVTVRDLVRSPGGGRADATVDIRPLAVGEAIAHPRGLDIDRRGLHSFGPLVLETTDPCGLVRRFFSAADDARLVALPRISVVEAPPTLADTDDPTGPSRPSTGGSEFVSLRDYVAGDDLRKVHWASSARRGMLVVRTDAHPIHPQCTIVLDARADAHDPTTFERSVSAAASIVTAASRAGQGFRLLITDGFDSAMGSGDLHLHVALRTLALVGLHESAGSSPIQTRGSTVRITTVSGITTGPGLSPAEIPVVFASATRSQETSPHPSWIYVPSQSTFAESWRIAFHRSSGDGLRPMVARS